MYSDYFTSFKSDLNGVPLPKKFTFPFYYEPHPLSTIACEELQQYLSETTFTHQFGSEQQNTEIHSGKMFGVLVVQTPQGELGYLRGYSGKLADGIIPSGFVPHIYDQLANSEVFDKGMVEVHQLTEELSSLKRNADYLQAKYLLQSIKEQSDKEIEQLRMQNIKAKKARKNNRSESFKTLNSNAYNDLLQTLAKESVMRKAQLNQLTGKWNNQTAKQEETVSKYESVYKQLQETRKLKSNGIQQQIFDHYQFLNQAGKRKSLTEIFTTNLKKTPPSGAGDCAAPKLLQYAFSTGLKPIAMAEFWWGKPPKSAIRKHKHFYPACTGKCQPILEHMLEGMQVDPNPMKVNTGEGLVIQTVFEDGSILAINKPSGLLSVPSTNVQDSVLTRLQAKYPNATGPLIVHRLDQSTSGVMLIAKSKDAHKFLQKQFINRTIKKRYVAVLDGVLTNDTGTIDLPLRLDRENPPNQLVCETHGKSARTHFKVVDRNHKQTRIEFEPVTGRTHQLRVHASHPLGLNMPILGDSLYGEKADRLYLHAESISFIHPKSRKDICFQVNSEF